MHAIDFLKAPAKNPIKPVYVISGDDPFLRRESFAAIRHQVLQGEDEEMGLVRFAGDHASYADVIDEVRTVPIFVKRKVVMVEGADPFVTRFRKELEGYVEHPASSGVLVLGVKTWLASTNLAKKLTTTGLAIDCKSPSEKMLSGWLVQVAKSRSKVVLEPDAANLLLEMVGPEVGLLVSEIEKLATYVGDRARIQSGDVSRMVGSGRIEDVWKVLSAATTGRSDVALDLVDRLLGAGEPPVKFLAGMTSSLRRVHRVGQLRSQGMSLDQACVEAGVNAYVKMSIGAEHAHLGPRRVDQLPALLLQADLDLKGASTLSPRLIIEKLLTELSRPRKD